jgi:Zn-dependent protease
LAGVDFEQIFVSFLVLIVSLTVHEAAHAWSANQLGDPTARLMGRLSLNPVVHVDPIGTLLFPLIALMTGLPLIGWAKPVPVDPRNLQSPRRDFAIVAAAGPISNVLMAAAGAVAFRLGPAEGVVAYGLLLFVLVNLLLAVFNMIPVPPLDGGNVLMGILPLSMARGVERLRPYGFLIIYALMLTGILGAITVPVRTLVLTWLL